MNDATQTPTDQPSELDAIRAGVDKHGIKLRVHMNGDGRYSHEECQDIMGHARGLLVHCRRLLELLDDRDEPCDVCAGTGTPISGYPCICGGSGKAIDSIPHFREVIYEKDSDIKRLQIAYDERDEETAATLADILIEARKAKDSELAQVRRELAEAREIELIWVQKQMELICKIGNDSAKPETRSAIRANAVNRAMSELMGRIGERRGSLKPQPNQTSNT